MELLLIALGLAGIYAVATGKVKNPFGAAALPAPSNTNNGLGSTPGTGDHGTGIIVTPQGAVPLAPPLPSLPALPPGVQPAIPSSLGALAAQLPQLDKIPAGFIPGVLDSSDALGPIVPGDVINVDMFKSGMAIPQNLPVVGLIFMRVVNLAVDGDSAPPKKLLAEFVSPEFRVMGQQNINRSSIVEKVTNS